jgi:hypothetical protein
MIADDGSPILMDFGSTVKYVFCSSVYRCRADVGRARISIENRQQALIQQVSLANFSRKA